ncbi:HAD family hydrolase [Moraxella sp. ZY210820]|uniref:HAD family hydrolase n=1 Tax=unclassified Moraxella TaxID=2685852 RepID=UPI00272FF9F2|nr:HAD-IA family hydrolase [Moraxella sp. ZY210820]WLF83752.1 HAD-IA family hydrolase [Moraxella sp. ZY210820]
MKQAVLFDLDGTLIDTAKDFIRIIQHMAQQQGLARLDDDLIRSQVSEGGRAMVHLLYPNLALDSAELWQYRQQFLDIYEQNICVDTTLFDGMNELLLDLEQRDIAWGIVTNKPRYLTELLLKSLNLTERCAVLVCPEDVSKTKPDPEPMYLACKQLDIAPEQCIYVGDHPRDIEAGRNAQMYTMLASYGYLPLDRRDDLLSWQADEIVADVATLHQAILKRIT